MKLSLITRMMLSGAAWTTLVLAAACSGHDAPTGPTNIGVAPTATQAEGPASGGVSEATGDAAVGTNAAVSSDSSVEQSPQASMPESTSINSQSAATLAATTASTGWTTIPQWFRNQLIFQTAFAYNNQYVGLECKPWVTAVVKRASGGLVNLPATSPDAYGYEWYPSRYVARVMTGIRGAFPGAIVQMNLSYRKPHTLIVYRVNDTSVDVIESNWKLDRTVRTRNVPFSDFDKMYAYRIYQVIGG